MTEDRSIT